jgi:protein-L-isoaspartate(D-aspartate) O-methyltransferase
MLIVTRRGQDYAARFTQRVAFYPCIGARDPATEAALRTAFATRDVAQVRSLRRAPSAPDETCWAQGDGWWLSSA